MNVRTAVGLLVGAVLCSAAAGDVLLDLNFNSGVDDFGNSTGSLVFGGAGTFLVTFADDDSAGTSGGDADGVHITNANYGNIKVGSATPIRVRNIHQICIRVIIEKESDST